MSKPYTAPWEAEARRHDLEGGDGGDGSSKNTSSDGFSSDDYSPEMSSVNLV